MNVRLIFASALSIVSISVHANVSHPLDASIRALNLASVELDIANSKLSSDAELAKKAAELRTKASNLVRESLVAPLTIEDTKLSRLGFELRWANELTKASYTIVENGAAAQLTEDSFELKSADWLVLGQKVEQMIQLVPQYQKFFADPAYIAGLTWDDKNNLIATLDRTRLDELKKLQQRVKLNLACINYFSNAYATTGLVPEAASANGFTWASAPLFEKFGVLQIVELEDEQKTQAYETLRDYVRKATTTYWMACVRPETVRFFDSEMKKLK